MCYKLPGLVRVDCVLLKDCENSAGIFALIIQRQQTEPAYSDQGGRVRVGGLFRYIPVKRSMTWQSCQMVESLLCTLCCPNIEKDKNSTWNLPLQI